MEVIAIFDVLRRHVYLIIMLTIVTGLAGYAISFFTPLIPKIRVDRDPPGAST